MGDVLRGPLAAYRLERDALWRHALAVAVGASHLVEDAGDRQLRERAFTAGLVHDIGKLMLNTPLKSKLQQLPQSAGFDVLIRGEREILGFDHAEAGAALAVAWNFPGVLTDVIGGHHDLERAAAAGLRHGSPDAESGPRLLPAVAAANLTASLAGLGAGTVCAGDDAWRAALDRLGFDPDSGAAVLARLPGDVQALAEVLGGRP